MRALQISEPVAYHGEGPVWWDGWGGLRWVDMLAGDVLWLAPDGVVHRKHVGGIVAALRPRVGGGAVLGLTRGFALEAPDGVVLPLPALWSDPTVRMNEGACDPQGCFWCGSMAMDRRPGAGALWCLDPDGGARVMLRGVTTSNGLDWSPEGDRAYYVDTGTRAVAAFAWDPDAGLSDRRVVVDFPEGLHPDGLTVDAEGGIWVALHHGGEVRRYTPDGRLDGVVEVPVREVTACTFGGPDLRTLYVTTSRENLPPDAEPLAGALFAATVGVRGRPPRTFAG